MKRIKQYLESVNIGSFVVEHAGESILKDSFVSNWRQLVPFIETPISFPDSKVHGSNMGTTWVLSAPDGSHVGPMNLATRVKLPSSWLQFGKKFNLV